MKSKLVGLLIVVFLIASVGIVAGSFNTSTVDGKGFSYGWDGTRFAIRSIGGGILIDPENSQCEIDGALTVDSCTGCDYVFESGYKLLPLDDLRAHISANHRLPGFSRDEAGRTNVNVTISQLTEKTEEQALYILQLHEQLKDLGARLACLEGK